MNRAEVVSGRWLVKAILAMLVAAGVALYLTVCLLFYQGQWQFVFSPSAVSHSRATNADWQAGSWVKRTGAAPAPRTAPLSAGSVATTSGLPISDHRFDYTEEGVARLDGWWIPAATGNSDEKASQRQASEVSQMVVLFCPDGQTDLPGNVPALRAFHSLGVSVFAFDYRGFGASQQGHPSERKAYEDGTAALHYLTGLRHIEPNRIVLYGGELGSAVAAHVAQQSPKLAGIILENPQPSLMHQVKREQHIHVLPMWLIFSERFDISRVVPTLKMPKLLIVAPTKPEYEPGAAAIYDEAVAPKKMVRVESTAAPLYTRPAWRQAVSGFLQTVDTNAAAQSR